MTPETADGFVTWAVYLEDRKELRGALRELSTDVKAMRSEMDVDNGREGAIAKVRGSRGDFIRDCFLIVAGAALAVLTQAVIVWTGLG